MTRFTGHDLECFRGERTVFRGLAFALGPGGALVLTGANGSGKSSLLRLMAGLASPAAGRLEWDGQAVADDPGSHHRRLRYVGHLDPVKPALTVAENLNFWAAMAGAADARAVAARALDAFGIGRLAALPARYLSAGQKRRVNLCRLLLAPAALWLLDEPATALDRDAKGNLADAIRDHRAAGGMVVVSAHAETPVTDADTLELSGFRGTPR
ncbi:MAG TPA: heme ABC exporter ATP-binding protein CcmA [Rhodospirillales bacterium]